MLLKTMIKNVKINMNYVFQRSIVARNIQNTQGINLSKPHIYLLHTNAILLKVCRKVLFAIFSTR